MRHALSGVAPPSPGVRPGTEERALSALRTVHPELAARFAPALEQARAAGLGKLWVALTREQLGGVSPAAGGGRAVLRLPGGSRLGAPAAVMDAFAEHQPGLCVDGPGGAIDHPVDLLAAVAADQPPGPDQDRWDGLAHELAESVANHALALVGEARRRDRLGFGGSGTSGAGAPGALCWAARRAAADPGFSPLAVFEQAIVDGHPLHPCARIRGGMSTEDLFAYAPEWADEVPVAIVAVAATACTGAPSEGPSMTGLLRRWHPLAADAAQAHLERLGRDPERYELLPVHPWQVHRTLPARYAGPLADGRVVVVPGACIAARPLLSLRTLVPAADRRAAHLKTAVDVRLTTAVRTVSPSAARNGPAVSRLVARICRTERGFGGRFAALAEMAGGSYVPGPGEPGDLAAGLAAIVRESPERHAGPGEVALPAAALAARSPTTGRPLLADVLDDLALTQGLSLREAGARFLDAYCDCALPPLLTLLSRWGIGLEPHGENLIVVLHGGLPVRMLYRDFGGIRISPARVASGGLPCPQLTGALPTGDEDELRAKFLFPLVETNLGQIVATLARVSGCDPARLWEVIARCARTTYASLAAGAAGPAGAAMRAQIRRDEAALFAPVLHVKSMLRTQLSGTPHAAQWVAVPNPMATTS